MVALKLATLSSINVKMVAKMKGSLPYDVLYFQISKMTYFHIF